MKALLENVNPKIALEWITQTDEIPESMLSQVTTLSTRNPVSNLGMPYLFFTDSSLFSPAANAFRESQKRSKGLLAAYTPYLEGTTAYKNFWREEKRRCIDGYEPEIDGTPCGVRITGEHYFYLNYCRIQKKVKLENGKVKKEEDFPDFVSMDYYWFHILEKAEHPTRFGLTEFDMKHLCMSKARRKGWSYKNAAGAVHIYTFVPDGRVMILSQYGDKGRETFKMCLSMIDFINKYTEFRQPWTQRRMQKNDCIITSGAEEDIEGVKTYKGIRTHIETISLKDKPDNAAGRTATRILIEEAGQIPDLKAVLEYTEPTLRTGDYLVGIFIVFGTGGENEGNAKEFSEVFHEPDVNGFMSFDNIYEEGDVSGNCAYFVDDLWYRPGESKIENKVYEAVDVNGNAYRWVAELSLDKERLQKKKGDKVTYATFLSQHCKTPQEAFAVVQGNVFDVADLQAILAKRRSNKEFSFLGRNGQLVEIMGEVTFVPDMKNILQPIDEYPLPHTYKNRDGCVIQYEAPREVGGFIQPGSYVICMDPIDIDNDGGESLCSIIVLKTMKFAGLIGGDEIVMEYIGRPKEDTIDECNRIALKMCKYYNAKLSNENDRGGKVVTDFFIKNNAYHMLLTPPNRTVSGHIQNSKTALRKTGHSMSSEQMKELGEIYLKKWLRKVRITEGGKQIRNMDIIPSKRLLMELLMYNRAGNFDHISAMFGGVLQLNELFNEYKEEVDIAPTSIGSKFSKKINNYYKR